MKYIQSPTLGFLDHPISLRAHVLFFGCPSTLTSTLRNFATFFALDFLQLLDALGKRWKYDIILQQGFKKLLNGLLDSPFLGVTIASIFRSSSTSFFLGDCCI